MKDFRNQDHLKRMNDDFALAEESRVATAALDKALGGEPEPVATTAPVTFAKRSYADVERPQTFPVLRSDTTRAFLAQSDDITPVLDKLFSDVDVAIQFPEVAALSNSAAHAEIEVRFKKMHGVSDDAPAKPFVNMRVTPELHKAASAGGVHGGTGVCKSGPHKGRRYAWRFVDEGTDDERIECTWL